MSEAAGKGQRANAQKRDTTSALSGSAGLLKGAKRRAEPPPLPSFTPPHVSFRFSHLLNSRDLLVWRPVRACECAGRFFGFVRITRGRLSLCE